MVDNYNIFKQCQVCRGSGKVIINNGIYEPGPPQEIDCKLCSGVGKIFWGEMLEQEE